MNIIISWSPHYIESGGLYGRSQLDITKISDGVSETITVKLPRTIYGGEVDVLTGEGVETWAYIEHYNGEVLPREWISDLDGFSDSGIPTTGAFVVYKLGVPIPFTIGVSNEIEVSPDKDVLQADCDRITILGTVSSLNKRVIALEQAVVGSIQ